MTKSAVPEPVLAALGQLNAHARATRTYGLRDAIYAYKTATAATMVKARQASVRFVKWTGPCNRCSNGRFQHWSWDDGHTVACRDCGGTGKRTLRFTETTFPGGQIWHHPWFTGDGKGYDIARRAIDGLYMDDNGDHRDLYGVLLVWHDVGAWRPNLPGAKLARDELVAALNVVEDWMETVSGDDWTIRGAKRHLSQRTFRGNQLWGTDPSHSYVLDLGRAPGGCFVCGDAADLAGFCYGRETPLFHWSLPVCRRHGEGPEKAPHPDDPPPAELMTPEIGRWLERHGRVVEHS